MKGKVTVLKEVEKEVEIGLSELVNQYVDDCGRRNLSPKTIESYKDYMKMFFMYLKEQEILNISYITQDLIAEYINSSSYALTSKTTISYVLRNFFNYTYINKSTCFSGNDVFPIIRRNNRSRILSFYSKEEIRKIIDTIDNSTPNGKKDYMVVLLASTLAMRSSDIINLKLENINWDKQTIEYIQQKTKKPIKQPFTDEVKYALLDYLKNARPKSLSDHILIRLTAPYCKYQSIYRIIDKYFKLANINTTGKKHGPHSLRHSFSNNLLSDNVSMQNISALLGHNFLSTTQLYTDIDITSKKLLALEVPDYERT